METKKELFPVCMIIKYERGKIYTDKFPEGFWAIEKISQQFDQYPKEMYEGKNWYFETEKEYGQEHCIVQAYPIDENNEKKKMSETKKGVVSYVANAESKGIKFNDDPNKWYNPTEEAKPQITADLKGKEIEIEIGEDGKFTLVGVSDTVVETNTNSTVTKTNSNSRKPKTIKIGNNEFVQFEELLNIAHDIGLKEIITEPHTISENLYIFKATVTLNNLKRFTAYGDATPQNVGAQVKQHIIRMAETRAIARALRFATNVGMCSAEELGENKDE